MSQSSQPQHDENQDKIDFGYTQVLKQDKANCHLLITISIVLLSHLVYEM